MAEQVVNWRKSTASANGETCVEVGSWHKSSYSAGQAGTNCVEVAAREVVLVRDTTDRGGVTLSISGTAWTSFLSALR